MYRPQPANILRALLGVAISAGFVWFLVTKLNLSQVWRLLLTASPRWIAAGIALLTVDYLLRATRWWLMIRSHSPEVGMGATLGVLLAGFAANNVLPLRAGDVMRAFWFTRRLRSSSGFLLGTLILERTLDLLTLLTISLLAVTLTNFQLPHPQYLRFVALMIVLGIGGLVAAFTMASAIESILSRIVYALLGKRPIAVRIVSAIRSVLAIFAGCGPRLAITLIALSFAAWALEGTVYLMVARALHLQTALAGPWLAFVLGNFAAMIPSAPGYIGTFHAAAIAALVATGCERNAAASFAVLVHAIMWVWITLAGAAAYFLVPEPQRKIAQVHAGIFSGAGSPEEDC
jgi:uncharacterized protein (TIRG00374 family)